MLGPAFQASVVRELSALRQNASGEQPAQEMEETCFVGMLHLSSPNSACMHPQMTAVLDTGPCTEVLLKC